MRRAALFAIAVVCGGAAAQTPQVVPLPGIEVVGIAPLPGLGTPLNQVPSNVQTFGARDLSGQRTGGVAEFLDLNANSVALESPTGNAFQPDVSFRGFTASSLLGTPQGLSVYQDGVRINEAFADVVNWDLLPKNAVAAMQLLPGSNPVFGLNTLGGALTLTMKDGFAYPGGRAEISSGSFGRTELAAEGGANDGTLGAFAAFEAIDDAGWRDHSTTRIRRLYVRGDAHGESDDGTLAATLADNHLEGTQALPASMLGAPKQPYTWPDTTENRLGFVSGTWRHAFDPKTMLTANAYYRQLTTSGINSNVNGEYAPPDDPYQGFNLFSDGTTRGWGASLQASALLDLGATRHQLILGAAYDAGRTNFAQSAQPAEFSADREARGLGPFVPGTAVTTENAYAGVYAVDTIALDRQWTVMLAGRYNSARVSTLDRTGDTPAINGSNSFRRFNPAVGATWTASAALNAFASISQGMRVPSPVELTCSDPNAPCTLPNIFVADPPLAPVRATTFEAGVRGSAGAAGWYRAAAYRTDLADDIQFISAGQGAINAGYFRNVGNTRRQGLELEGGVALEPFRLIARYSVLDATFRTPFVEHSPNNVTANGAGDILVESGDTLPLMPRQMLRLRGEWARGGVALGANLLAVGSQYSRGNENNADPGGTVPGYAIVTVDASWQPAPAWRLFARIDNLFNRAYQNFGILGSNFFRGPGNTFDAALAGPEPFRSPAPPFGVWVGVEFDFDPTPARR